MTVINYSQYNVLVAQFPQLVIFAFPSPQFFNQEPGRNDEILNCLKYVRPGNGYVPKFRISEKINVNGIDVHPLYTFLKGVCPQPSPVIPMYPIIDWSPVTPSDITWNFEKFLINKQGIPYKRYDPTTPPLALVDDITMLMRE